MRKLLQLFGFYEDDYEDDYENGYSDNEKERRPESTKKPLTKKGDSRKRPAQPQLIFFRGIPSDDVKLSLRDSLLEGAMVLLDIQDLDEDRAESFINFMRGVAFAHKGESRDIGSSLYVITPREGMLQCWGEEE